MRNRLADAVNSLYSVRKRNLTRFPAKRTGIPLTEMIAEEERREQERYEDYIEMEFFMISMFDTDSAGDR